MPSIAERAAEALRKRRRRETADALNRSAREEGVRQREGDEVLKKRRKMEKAALRMVRKKLQTSGTVIDWIRLSDTANLRTGALSVSCDETNETLMNAALFPILKIGDVPLHFAYLTGWESSPSMHRVEGLIPACPDCKQFTEAVLVRGLADLGQALENWAKDDHVHGESPIAWTSQSKYSSD